MGKIGLQQEMDSFFKETEKEAFRIRRITKGGFSQSRKNLAPEAFLELNDIICKDFYKEVDYWAYKEHRLLAVDGTFLNLPNHASIKQEFGSRGRGKVKEFAESTRQDTEVTLEVPNGDFEKYKVLQPCLSKR